MARLAGVALVAAVAVGACSGDDAGEASGSTSTTTTSEPSTDVSFTGDADSEFCGLLRDADLGLFAGEGDVGDSGSVQEGLALLIDLFLDAELIAPAEIEADMTHLGEGLFLLDQALYEVDYDFDALPPDVVRAVDDPSFAEAGARIAAYREQVCRL